MILSIPSTWRLNAASRQVDVFQSHLVSSAHSWMCVYLRQTNSEYMETDVRSLTHFIWCGRWRGDRAAFDCWSEMCFHSREIWWKDVGNWLCNGNSFSHIWGSEILSIIHLFLAFLIALGPVIIFLNKLVPKLGGHSNRRLISWNTFTIITAKQFQ